MAQLHDKRRASTGIHAPPSGFLLLSLLLLLSVNVTRGVSLASSEVATHQQQLSTRKVSPYFSLLPPLTTLRAPPPLPATALHHHHHHQTSNRKDNSSARQHHSSTSDCSSTFNDSFISISSDCANSSDSRSKNNHKHPNSTVVRSRSMKQRVRRSSSRPIKPHNTYDSLQLRKAKLTRRSLDKKGSEKVEKTFDTAAKKGRNAAESYEPIVKNISKLINDEHSVENISGRTATTYKKAAESHHHHESEEQPSDKFYLLRDINGSLKLVFILLGVLGVASLASIIYCFWTTRRSAGSEQRRLTNDNSLLNQSDFDVLMLSVQNLPRCAGMERLGIPTSTIGSPQRDERSIRSTFPIPIQHDLIISANRQTHNLINESKTKTNSGIKTVEAASYKRCNIYTSCSINSSCPTHIARSGDGEFGREHYLNEINQQYYSEEKRNYIQAPPNKTIKDVPDAHQQQFQFKSCYSHSHHNNLRQISLSANHKKQHNSGINNHHHTTNEKHKGTTSEKFSSVFSFFKRDAAASCANAAGTGHHFVNINNNNNNNNNISNLSQSRSGGGVGGETTTATTTAADISKLSSNMPRSNHAHLSTDTTSNELDIRGSTNLNQHSKLSSSTINNTSNNATRQLSRSPSTASTGTKKSFSSTTTLSSSNSSSEQELKNCL